jgi:SAM-dependent methyltransferase
MNEDFEKLYHQLEKKHFWFKARRGYILQELNKVDRDAKILDIGCSSGILLEELAQMGFQLNNLYGIDISEKAINNCKSAGLENTFVMDAQKVSLNQKFDIIIASDCLEHLANDEEALANWSNLLNTNGIAYIFVPAFMTLWSEHDEANMHFRRYTQRELIDKLKKNGFEIKKSSYWNFSLFMPILLIRFLSRLKPSKGKNTGNLDSLPLFNSLLFSLLNFENKLLKHLNFHVGVSAFCVATKASSDNKI